ncbi:MAG: indolepyruvate oxidoreductase subunit beta [Oscillospiraceae bacterium]|nr:indolepyruvate oxidoreductase subunit beta [Oscillospiraceae bacterium]
MIKNLLIVGVGGQGSLLATRIVGHAALGLGYDVKVSEVHGMSQRGGAVVTYARYGEKVYSPVICRGEADLIISFEQLEALRWISYLKRPGGVLLTSTQKINPLPVITGDMEYPGNITGQIKAAGVDVITVDAFDKAAQAGNDKTVNVVMMGAFAKFTAGADGFTKQVFIEALHKSIGERNKKLIDVNLKAFELGYECI